MLSAVNENNEFVLATESEKTDGNFFCKGCRSHVLLKKGNIKIHHFSHVTNKDCDFGLGGESEKHYKIKLFLYKFLLKCKQNKKILDVELEKNIDGLRADLWFKNNDNQEIAIEIQLSPRTKEYIKSKIQRYTNNKVATLYITDLWDRRLKTGSDRIRLASWQMFLQEISFGNLYTFTESIDNTFRIMKIYPQKSRVRETIFYTNKKKEINLIDSMEVFGINDLLFYEINYAIFY